MEAIVSWVFAFIMTVAPPGPWRGEPRDETIARYRQIAEDAVAVAYDPGNDPLFGGDDGRARTAALMLSVAYHESGFRRDVDFGVGPNARGDSGQSWCLMQIRVGGGRTIEGWSGRDLVRNRRHCFSSGLGAIRRSFIACRNNSRYELLNAYTSGSCNRGAPQSRDRMTSAFKWVAQHPVPHNDESTATGLLQKPEREEYEARDRALRSN